jgi:hypothetical protein
MTAGIAEARPLRAGRASASPTLLVEIPSELGYALPYASGKDIVPHVGDIHVQRRPLLIEGGRTLDVRLAADVGP